MDRLARAALAATLSILLVAGGALAVTQSGDDDLATLQAAPWTLTELDGEPIDASAGITASFGSDGSLTGFAGCNDYNGTYVTEGDDLTVSPLAATRKACDGDVMANENLYLDLLESATSWSISGASLSVLSADGGVLIYGGEPTEEPAPFAGTEWLLTSVDGQPVDPAIGASAVFAEDFTVAGFGGCNQYSGPYAIDGGSIKVGPVAATRKLCEPEVMDVENAFLGGLELVTTVAIVGREMTLAADDGSSELVLTAGGSVPGGGSLTGATWELVDIDGDPAVEADGVTVTFGEDGSIEGFGGCNQLFGTYTADESEITVSGLATTRKACEQEVMDREAQVVAILSDATTWSVEDGELTITGSDGAELIFTSGGQEPVATHAPVADGGLVGPVWELTELMGQAIPTAFVSVTISFAEDGTVSGNGGCNDFAGTYTINGDKLGLVGLAPIESRDDCDQTGEGVEEGIFQILPFLDTWSVSGDQLTLDGTLAPVTTVWTAKG